MRTSRFALPLLLTLAGARTAWSQDETPQIPDDTNPVTTESGLTYSVLSTGEGEGPRFGDRVKVHYTGWLTDGTVFDSSRQRGTPSEFAIGRVIEGWNEGLQLMKPGTRLKLTIPPGLAYGEKAQGKIPADATLVFDVELIEVTMRALPYVEWSADGASKTSGGLEYRFLEPGDGLACSEAELVILDFAMYDGEGKIMLASSMEGSPLIASPTQMQLAFLSEVVPLARGGSKMLVQVPAAQLSRLQGMPGFDTAATYTWQLFIAGAYKFDKPDFQLPPDEELTTTASGLKYKVLREGSGKQPIARNTVVAHYAGWLTDGTPFDNSYDRGQASSFPLANVISGWTEGLQLMHTGSMFVFVIPSDLGYGDGGSPPKIPGGATLVFIVELVDVR